MDNTKRYMNVFIAVIILILMLNFYSPAALAQQSDSFSSFMDLESSVKELQDNVDRVHKSIVSIITYDKKGEVSRVGSGFIIDSRGLIMTNARIMQNAYSAEVFSVFNNYKDVVVLSRRQDIDLALLKVNASNEIPVDLDYGYKPGRGERVIVVGKSPDLITMVSEGLISDINRIDGAYDYMEIETTAGLLRYKRSKSGPVINMDGSVVAITTGIVPESMKIDMIPRENYGENLYALSIETIKSMTDGEYLHETLKPPGTRVMLPWLLGKLNSYAGATFVILYDLGFMKIMAFFLALTLFVWFIQVLFSKIRRVKFRK